MPVRQQRRNQMNKATLILEGELSLEGKCHFWFSSPETSGFLSEIVSRHFTPGEDPHETQFGRCRATFLPLANQGGLLMLEGSIAISMGSFILKARLLMTG